MKLASFNISGGFYGGDESTEYFDRAAVKSIDNKLLDDIIRIINDEKLDVIAFQEIITTPEIGYIQKIVDATELKYWVEFETSPCNLVQNTNCGLAILSRFPIGNVKKLFFPNPKLSKTTKSGNTYYSYDKGILVCDIQSRRILTHHNFPFRRFNSSSREHQEVFDFFDAQIKEFAPDIVTGDFNTDDFMDLMPELAGNYRRTIDGVTTVDGKSFDDIVVHNEAQAKSYMIESLSDHFCVICEVE